jgi:hypothetical protein
MPAASGNAMSIPMIAMLCLFGLVVPVFLISRGRRALRMARMLRSAPAMLPANDADVALRGRLNAVDAPLSAPFSGRSAVSVRHAVVYRGLGGGQPGAKQVETEVQGFAQTRTRLRTLAGDVLVLAALHAVGEDDEFDPARDAAVAARVRGMLDDTGLVVATTPAIVADGSLLALPSGEIRHAVATRFRAGADADRVRLAREGVVAENAEVTVIGRYRAADRALVTVDELLPADAEAARAALKSRAYAGFVVAVLCFVVALIVGVFNSIGSV